MTDKPHSVLWMPPGEVPPCTFGLDSTEVCGKETAYVLRMKSWEPGFRGTACIEHALICRAKKDLEWIRSVA